MTVAENKQTLENMKYIYDEYLTDEEREALDCAVKSIELLDKVNARLDKIIEKLNEAINENRNS